MATEHAIAGDFESLFKELESERTVSESIRDKSKDLDRCFRSLSSLLNAFHSTPGDKVTSIVDQVPPLLVHARTFISDLSALVPEHQYYRFNDDFSSQFKNLVSSISLVVFVATGGLVTKPQVATVLGLTSDEPTPTCRLKLSTEEYLHGLINFINELPRLAVNSVTMGDFRTPVRLAAFVKEVHAGFQLLNLKNDSLRKRFDGIKYDVKKIEEVVYDISLRGLIQGEDDGKSGVAFNTGPEAQQHLINRLAGRT